MSRKEQLAAMKPHSRRARSSLVFLAAFIFPFALYSAHEPPRIAAAAVQVPHRKPNKSKAPAAIIVSELPMPFRAGETLNYQVEWSSFLSAASVQFTIPERRNLFGWRTWHFRAVAHTLSPVRTLFAIDDQFDSYTDAATLESRQYELYLSEMGRRQNQVLHFLPEAEISRAPGPFIMVPPGTHDPLGELYALRAVDWRRTAEVRTPVCDGRDVYQVVAKLDGANESASVVAGTFSASRISIRVFQRGKEVSGMNFAVWLAHDAARTPVLMEATLPFGRLRIELTSKLSAPR